MSTDLFLKRIWMAALLLWLMPLARAEKPNVLLLLVDDLKPAMGCYGDRHAITPAMDALAARTRPGCSTPSQTASRAPPAHPLPA